MDYIAEEGTADTFSSGHGIRCTKVVKQVIIKRGIYSKHLDSLHMSCATFLGLLGFRVPRQVVIIKHLCL